MRICNLDSASCAERSSPARALRNCLRLGVARRGEPDRGTLEDDGFLRARNADQEMTD
jgi:hypothetical protein